MSFESLIAAAQRLSTSVEALAALGAQLRLQQDGLEGNLMSTNKRPPSLSFR
jgi:hypothetical protein